MVECSLTYVKPHSTIRANSRTAPAPATMRTGNEAHGGLVGSPEAARRSIGAVLAALRKSAKLTQEQTAGLMGTNQSNLSHMEAGRRAPTVAQLKLLLKELEERGVEVGGETREELLNLAGASRYPNWWAHQFGGTAVPEYARSFINLERGAAEKCTYDAERVPGLLQTEAVVRTLFATTADLVDLDAAEVRHRVKVRLARQEVLTRTDPAPLRLRAVVNEAVLHRPIGSPELMREQLLHMVKVAGLPNVTLQVLPFSAGPHPASGVSFELLRQPGQGEPEIVYQEGLTTATYLDRPEDVRGHMLAYDRVSAAALDPVESLTLIASVADEYLRPRGAL